MARKEEKNKYGVPEKTEEQSIRDANARDIAQGKDPVGDAIRLARAIARRAMDVSGEARNELPPLIDLPVVRNDRCDQSTIDQIARHLWNESPGLVVQLAGDERTRRWMFGRDYHELSEALRLTPHIRSQLPTRLSMIEAVHEVGRRLRAAQDLAELPIVGRALAPSREGPFPKLIDRDAVKNPGGSWSLHDLPFPVADRFVRRAYEADPELMYDVCEAKRRLIALHDIHAEVRELFENVWAEEDLSQVVWTTASTARRDLGHCRLDLHERLSTMCGMPTHEELLALMEVDAGD